MKFETNKPRENICRSILYTRTKTILNVLANAYSCFRNLIFRGGGRQRSNLKEKNPGSQFLLIKYTGPKCGVKKPRI